MKPTLLASAVLGTLTAAALAAPVAPPQADVVAPSIDPAAVALLDQSVAAYRALDGLTLKFTTSGRFEGKEQPKRAAQGTLWVQGPDKARLESAFDGGSSVIVGNKGLRNVQFEPNSYWQERNDDVNMTRFVISMLSAPLGNLMTGANTLAPERGFGWKSVTLSPAHGLDGVALNQKFTPTTYRIYFDPQSHLVRRIETESGVLQEIGGEYKKSETTMLLTPQTADITPATFVYAPPAGAKMTDEADVPKFYNERLVVGVEPFPLTGQTMEGKPLSLGDYQGKVVLLDFWATWCEPCIAELPTLEANYNKYRDQGFDIISIAKADNEATVRAFVKEHGIAWTQVDDGEQMPNVKTYGARGIPFAILIGKDGKIAAINLRGEELEPAIIKALAR